MKSWRTTLAGLVVAGFGMAEQAFPEYAGVLRPMSMLATVLLGYLARDQREHDKQEEMSGEKIGF